MLGGYRAAVIAAAVPTWQWERLFASAIKPSDRFRWIVDTRESCTMCIVHFQFIVFLRSLKFFRPTISLMRLHVTCLSEIGALQALMHHIYKDHNVKPKFLKIGFTLPEWSFYLTTLERKLILVHWICMKTHNVQLYAQAGPEGMACPISRITLAWGTFWPAQDTVSFQLVQCSCYEYRSRRAIALVFQRKQNSYVKFRAKWCYVMPSAKWSNEQSQNGFAES